MPSPWMDQYDAWEAKGRWHRGHAFPTPILREIEALLPSSVERSAETGCGKSTILFSNLSADHRVFALDDREAGDESSVRFFEDCPLGRPERVQFVFGPTQVTLPSYAQHAPYDLVLIDGPHGYPFPELEYLALYPHITKGGLLIVDDVNIPTIGRLADFLAEDEMWEAVGLVSATAVFRRTAAPTFDPTGDGWWEQRYSRRRVAPSRDVFLDTGLPVEDCYSSMEIDRRMRGHDRAFPDLSRHELAEALAAAKAQVADLSHELAERDSRLSDVLGSRSWRYTAPLRRLGRG